MATSKGLQGIVSEWIKALYDFSLKAGWLCLPECTHRHKILNVFKAKRCSQQSAPLRDKKSRREINEAFHKSGFSQNHRAAH
jgi:hypothetical protein